ncbi:hypothetical protein ACFLZ0_02590 [Patescibacteria group bacterium]
MLLEKIKKILQKEGGKCIVVDENKDEYLVIEMHDFKEKKEEDKFEKINRDIDELKAQEDKKDNFNNIIEEEKDLGEVKVEDLPF